MHSFLTGSQVYGTPDELSDIDLVVLVSKEEKDFLFSKSEVSTKLMFGNLNIIALDKDYQTDVDKYNAWKQGTEYLKSIKPVTREFAIEHFASLGIKKKDYPEVNNLDDLVFNDTPFTLSVTVPISGAERERIVPNVVDSNINNQIRITSNVDINHSWQSEMDRQMLQSFNGMQLPRIDTPLPSIEINGDVPF